MHLCNWRAACGVMSQVTGKHCFAAVNSATDLLWDMTTVEIVSYNYR